MPISSFQNLMLLLPPLAQTNAMGVISSLAVGLGVGGLSWWVFQALASDDLAQGDQWRYDVSRINELRRLDVMYRLFQPIIQLLAKLNRSAFGGSLPEIGRQVQAAGLSRFWLPEEFLGRMQLIALLLMPMYLLLCIRWMGTAGAVMGLTFTGLSVWFLRRRLAKLARNRLVRIKRRLPYLLDMLTLLMEAGASFINALKQAVHEFEGHPAAIEFGRVLADMNMGKARTEAFENLRDRLNDDEITAIVGTIVQSEQLGTPVSDIFRTQADVLRVKRSQRAEALAGEAAVNMLLPGVLVMAATVIIILGPFLLNFLDEGLGL